MTAVLPNSRGDAPSPLYNHYHWIYTRGLFLRAIVSFFIWWNIMTFPQQSLPHAWIAGLLLLVVDALAWWVRWHNRTAIILWAMLTSAFDLILGLVALTDFSGTVQSSAPALLPLIGIELIAYWGWVGHWIAFIYSTIAIVTLWSFPRPQHSSGFSADQIIYWLVVNFLVISSVAVLLHRSGSAAHTAGLTTREREVYSLLKAGYSQKDIAEQLHIERSTVKTHVQHIHHKVEIFDEPP